MSESRPTAHARRLLRAATRGTLAALGAIAIAGVPAIAADATATIPATITAVLVPPMVPFQVGETAARRARADADELDALPTLAVLDTGASAHVLSHDTAERLGIRVDGGARWVETGLAGEHTLAVSMPYTLAIGAAPALLVSAQRLLLNDVPATAAAMLTSPGAIVDVVGMPALEHAVVELRSGDLGIETTALLPADAAADAEHWIALALVDFNHRSHPRNRGVPPTVAANPVLRGVRVTQGGREFRGDWLLDTGAAVTMLSTAGARALGLGEPAPLSVPVGGMSGNGRALPGWRVDRIELATTGGGVLALTDAAVFVEDVATSTDDGSRITLDGILGVNLLAAFPRVVIDVPHARLGVDLPTGAATRHRH